MPAPLPSDRRFTWLALLAGLSWLGASATLGFSYDDREVLFGNPVVEGALPWSSVFDRDYWHHLGAAGHWRPLATASLRVERALFGEGAFGYHLSNALVHLAVVLLAARLWRELWPRDARLAIGRGRDPLLLGLAFFALHPALADAVAWISGRTSGLSALGGGLGLLACLRASGRPHGPEVEPARSVRPSLEDAGGPRSRTGSGPRPANGPTSASGTSAGRDGLRIATPSLFGVALASFVGVALATMAKEDGVLFVPLCALVAARASRRAAGASLAGSTVAVALWLVARRAALGDWLPNAPFALLDGEPPSVRVALGLESLARLLPIVALPLPHPPTVALESLREGSSGAIGVAAALGALASASAASLAWLRGWRRACSVHATTVEVDLAPPFRRPRAPILSLSLLLALASWLPHAQLIPSGELFAPRFAYWPLLLGVPWAGVVLVRLPRVVGALVLVSLVPLGWLQARTYDSRTSFWERVLAFDPLDARAHNALGNALFEEALTSLDRDRGRGADETDPEGEDANDRRSDAVDEPGPGLGEARGSTAAEARSIGASTGGSTGAPNGLLDAARAHYERAVELQPTYARAWVNLGNLSLHEGEEFEAEGCLLRAVEARPTSPTAWASLGVLYWRNEAFEAARDAYRRATRLAPGRAASWRGLGRASRALGELDEARTALRRALELDPRDRVSARELSALAATSNER